MKVLVLGLTKSGTSILTYRILDAIPGFSKRLYFEPGARTGAEDIRLHRRQCFTLRSVVSKNLVYPQANTQWDNIFRVTKLYNRCVWIVRDPRDIIISNYFYHWKRGHNSPDDNFAQAMELTLRKENNPGSIPFHHLVTETMTRSKDAFINWQRSTYAALVDQADRIHQHCHVFRYEDMIEKRLDDLSDYLGFKVTNDVEIGNERKHIVRSKAYGNWRRWFNEADADFFKPLLNDYLARMGYDADDWRLETVDRLPASEGSEYMTRLRNKDAAGQQ